VAVFIELVTDAFEDNFARLADRYAPREHAGLTSVRRPLRGLEVKEDTYAMIKVIRSDGSEIPLVDSSHPSGERKRTSSFILQQVTEARMEKHQIVETFGEPYIFFFGESPRFLDVRAVLLNSFDFNWEAEFWHNWETKLRGTKSVELGARTYLFYDDNIVEGYMLMAQAEKSSSEPFIVLVSFRMFVTSTKNVSLVGDPNFPVHASVSLPPNVTLTSADGFSELRGGFHNEGRAGEALRALDDEVSRQARGGFGSRGRLAEALRRGSRSVAFAADVQAAIDALERSSAQDIPERDILDRLGSRPLRAKIADNTDEMTGSGSIAPDHAALPEVFEPRVRSLAESRDLFEQAITEMSRFGASIDSARALEGLGLGVSFGTARGVAIGRSGGALGASLGARSSASFGAAARLSAGARAGGSLGFGLETAEGDPNYGYASPFGGPGFGRAGFGDYGGLSFGSASGRSGDPGYRAPDEITLAGVEDERDAFERFVRPRAGFGSGLGGRGAGASFAGSGVGAVALVPGAPSAFALVVAEGSLAPSAVDAGAGLALDLSF
jgi:hypothetical protein